MEKNETNLSKDREIKEGSVEKKSQNKRVYVAYGSNMDICRMNKRCQDFEFLGAGYVYDYKLTFQQSTSGFYANLIPNKAKKNFEYTPVVIYLISEEDELSLDAFEGYPQAYKKVELEVEMEDGGRVKGLAYTLPVNRSYGIPTFQYYRLISNAYKIFDFDLDVLKNALIYSYKRAKNSLNSKVNNSIGKKVTKAKKDLKQIEPKGLTKEQKEFIQEFKDKNKSKKWELREAEGYIVLEDTESKIKDKIFEVIINEDRTITLKSIESRLENTVESIDSLLKCL